MCLFHVLLSLQEELDLKLYPVHINHKFRPGAAERDQDYVENLCAEHGIRCTTVVRDCGKLAAELGMTDEEAGRKVRYDAFRSVAEEIAAGRDGESPVSPEHIKIAVAQNANDQAETILFRLLRGTGPDGLAGIAYSRSEGRFRVIRPILDITRSEIENYCRDNGLDPGHRPHQQRDRLRPQQDKAQAAAAAGTGIQPRHNGGAGHASAGSPQTTETTCGSRPKRFTDRP